MNGQPKDGANESRGHMRGRADTHVTRADDVDELFRDWKRERGAFGMVLVTYAFLLSVALLIARYPNETTKILCASLLRFTDWRAWVLAVSVACLIAIAVIALKRRR